MRDIRACLFALVEPMGGDAVIGHIFHFVRANLDLDRYAVHSLQHGMQRLIPVGFWDGNVIFEFTRYWFVKAVHHP